MERCSMASMSQKEKSLAHTILQGLAKEDLTINQVRRILEHAQYLINSAKFAGLIPQNVVESLPMSGEGDPYS